MKQPNHINNKKDLKKSFFVVLIFIYHFKHFKNAPKAAQHTLFAHTHGCAETNLLAQDSFRRVCFVGAAVIWALPQTTSIAKRP